MEVRRAESRGHANHGWLDSFHSFSFADYHDSNRMGWSALRVINEDRISPGSGFGSHSHRDMEIISVVLDGELAHKDSMGNGSVIRPGDIQRMSAGTGIRHSEFNHAVGKTTHFLQIWIEPNRIGIAPQYEEKHFPAIEKRGRLRLVVDPDGSDGALRLTQAARIYAGLFDRYESALLQLAADRSGYVHVARGEISVNGVALRAGDAVAMLPGEKISVADGRDAEILVFDLP